MLYTTRNFLATEHAHFPQEVGSTWWALPWLQWPSPTPSPGKFPPSAISQGSHLSSARDVKSFTTGRACSSSCHNKSAPAEKLGAQVSPQASSCQIENMKTWSCRWQLLASTKVALVFGLQSDWSRFQGVSSNPYPRCHCPSHVLLHSLWSPPVSKGSKHTDNLLPFLVKLIPWKPPNLLMLQTSMTSQAQAYLLLHLVPNQSLIIK